MGQGGLGANAFQRGLRFAQSQHRTTRMGEHAIDSAIACEIFECRAVSCAENDEAGATLLRESENLDGWIAMDHHRLNIGPAFRARLTGQLGQLVHRG